VGLLEPFGHTGYFGRSPFLPGFRKQERGILRRTEVFLGATLAQPLVGRATGQFEMVCRITASTRARSTPPWVKFTVTWAFSGSTEMSSALDTEEPRA